MQMCKYISSNIFPDFVTNRFVLRQLKNSDLEYVFKGLSDPKVIKYYGVSFSSLEAAKEQMKWYSNLEKTKTGIWWAICEKKSGFFNGAIGLNDIDQLQKSAEIGFWLLPEYWGKGIIKECMTEIDSYSFQIIKLKKINAFIESENKKCLSLVKKLNFIHEKTLNNYEFKKGKPISLYHYSKINIRLL